jgi:hypothetical protein
LGFIILTVQEPNIKTIARFGRENVNFHIWAYRALTPEEVSHTIQDYFKQPSVRRKKKAEQNEIIVLKTRFGITENL